MPEHPASAFCKSCEYSLAGIVDGVCPECGRGFSLSDPKTYDTRPKNRWRKWTRRVAWAIGIIAVVWLLAPSRVAKLTWSWPNPDGVTATSETRWCLVAPRWLPIPYPRWSAARWTKPIEANGLKCAEHLIWRVRPMSVRIDMNQWISIGSDPKGLVVGMYGDSEKMDAMEGLEIQPQNIDKLCDWVLDPPTPNMTYGPRVLSTPPTSPGAGSR